MANKWVAVDDDDDDVNADHPAYRISITQPRGSTQTNHRQNHSQNRVDRSNLAQHQPRPQQNNQQHSFHGSQQQNDPQGYMHQRGQNGFRSIHQGPMPSRSDFNNQNGDNHQRFQNNMNAPSIMRPAARYPPQQQQQQQQQQQARGRGHADQFHSHPHHNQQQQQQMSPRQQFPPRDRGLGRGRGGSGQYNQPRRPNGNIRGGSNQNQRVSRSFPVIGGNEENEETFAICVYNATHLYRTADIRAHENMCPNRLANQQQGFR